MRDRRRVAQRSFSVIVFLLSFPGPVVDSTRAVLHKQTLHARSQHFAQQFAQEAGNLGSCPGSLRG
jgi:hypothetical protein